MLSGERQLCRRVVFAGRHEDAREAAEGLREHAGERRLGLLELGEIGFTRDGQLRQRGAIADLRGIDTGEETREVRRARFCVSDLRRERGERPSLALGRIAGFEMVVVARHGLAVRQGAPYVRVLR